MSLQLSRWVTFVDNVSQILANFLNPIQDQVIYLNGLIDDEDTTGLGASGSGTGATLGSDGSIVTASAGQVIIPLILPKGVTITDLEVWVLRTGSNDLVTSFRKVVHSTGSESQIAATATASGTRVAVDILVGEEVTVADTSYFIRAVAGAASTGTVFAYKVSWKYPGTA